LNPNSTPANKSSTKKTKHQFPIVAIALGAFAIVALVVIAKLLGKRNDAPALPESDSTSEQVAHTLAASIAAMLDDPDPRRAIIGAYARMLDGFAAAGLPRKPSDTPQAYLVRCLEALPIRPEAATTLTHLFAIARFSEHAMTNVDRDQAFDALRHALADVQGRNSNSDHSDLTVGAPS
jgi:hypothetical protein